MKITLDEAVRNAVEQHGVATFPNECCGFLYGNDWEVRGIAEARPVTNSKEGDQRRRFSISPKDYMAAERYALEQGTTLLGVYHSHPNHPAIPSEHDLRQALPFFSYIIVSIQEGKPDHLRSWRLDDAGAFAEEQIVPVPVPRPENISQT
ncbi:MAG: M67 family metallopeptidase [Bacteroidota bacterium]